MRTHPFYLVIGRHKGNGKIMGRRVTQRRPYLEPGEAVVKLALEFPDGILDAPVNVIAIEAQQVAVGIDAEVDDEPQS